MGWSHFRAPLEKEDEMEVVGEVKEKEKLEDAGKVEEEEEGNEEVGPSATAKPQKESSGKSDEEVIKAGMRGTQSRG